MLGGGPGAPRAVLDPQLSFPAEKHLVLLRDGRTLIGYLRSIDQFGTAGAAGSAGGEEEEGAAVCFSGVIVLGLNIRLCAVSPWAWCFTEVSPAIASSAEALASLFEQKQPGDVHPLTKH